MNKQAKQPALTINSFIAFIAALVNFPFGITFALVSITEFLEAGSLVEKIFFICSAALGVKLIEVSFFILLLIFVNKGKAITLEEPSWYVKMFAVAAIKLYFTSRGILLLLIFLGYLFLSGSLWIFIAKSTRDYILIRIYCLILVFVFSRLISFGFKLIKGL